MKVFLNINILLNGSEKFLKFLSIKELPYNVVVLNILDNLYKEYEICLVGKDMYFLTKAQQELVNEGYKVSIYPNYNIEDLVSDQEIILSCFNFKAACKAKKIIFVGNIFQYFLHMLCFYSKIKLSRCIMFNGLLSELIFQSNFWIALLSMWPLFFESRLINQTFTLKYFVGNILLCSSSNIFKSILSIDKEIKHMKNELEPITAKEFVLGSTNIDQSFLLSSILFLCGIIYLINNPKALFFSISCAVINYITNVYPFLLRFFIIIIWLISALLFLDMNFAKTFLNKIF